MTYLFLAVPPYSGSTVLHNYIAKCKSVAQLVDEFSTDEEDKGLIEGDVSTTAVKYYSREKIEENKLAALPGILGDILNNPKNYNWPKIKETLDANWASQKSTAKIFLQKTPYDVYRVQMMQKFFNAHWIVMVREPFAWASTILQRMSVGGIDTTKHLADISSHIINTYKIQRNNKEALKDKAYSMTFESFVKDADKHTAKIKEWVPDLYDLSFVGNCMVKTETVDGLFNNNLEKISYLKKTPETILALNKLFLPYRKEIEYWGYEASLS